MARKQNRIPYRILCLATAIMKCIMCLPCYTIRKGGATAFYNGFQAAIGGITLSDQICSNNVQRTYTVEQVSRILGISLRKTYYLCEHTTDFKVIRLGKRCLRIHKESFDSWFNALDQP